MEGLTLFGIVSGLGVQFHIICATFYFFFALAKLALPRCVVDEKALFQTFGWSFGSYGHANVLSTVRWFFISY